MSTDDYPVFEPDDADGDYEVRHEKRPKLKLTRRDFVAGGTALGIGGVAMRVIGGNPASAQQFLCPDPTDPTLPPKPPPISVTSTTSGGSTTTTTTTQAGDPTTTSTTAGGTTPSEPPPGSPWSSHFSDNEGDVVITSDIKLDINARVRSLKIDNGGRLIMAPESSITLVSTGNVVVLGELIMQPNSAAQVHTIRFEGVNEQSYVGGGMKILGSDVGLWIAETGQFTGWGSAKTPWTRATGSVAKGANKIGVDNAAGWQVGDQVAITPTGAPSKDNGSFHQNNDCATAYDEVRITAVNGNEITVDKGMAHDHPMMSLTSWTGSAVNYGAEVLNLTRNVVISGTEGGRAHAIFMHCQNEQNLQSVQFDLMGPRKNVSNGRTDGVSGRYPFHMHHCGDGSRGSVIKDCLVTRSGNRAFVPHESHGVTLTGCVGHDVHGSAYWWDQPGRHNPTGEDPKTHDSLWTRCVASKVVADQKSENGYRMAGFVLGGGNDLSNTLIDSVAVGVTRERVTGNTSTSSGFHWPEHGQATWNFKNCLAHNIGGDGILTWQNRELVHVLEDFTAYHCAGHGVEHGAYSNFYRYERMALVANRLSGIGCHAVTRRTNSVRRAYTDKGKQAPMLEFRDVRIDGRGITVDGVQGLSHRFAAHVPDGPTIMENVVVDGCTRAGLYETKGRNAQYYILKGWRVNGVDPVMFDSGAPAATRVDVVNMNGSNQAYTVRK